MAAFGNFLKALQCDLIFSWWYYVKYGTVGTFEEGLLVSRNEIPPNPTLLNDNIKSSASLLLL